MRLLKGKATNHKQDGLIINTNRCQKVEGGERICWNSHCKNCGTDFGFQNVANPDGMTET